MKVMSTVFANHNTHAPVNDRFTDHGKCRFDWSSNRTVEENVLSNWMVRKRLLELDGKGNVFSNWMVMKTLSRAGWLRELLLELDVQCL